MSGRIEEPCPKSALTSDSSPEETRKAGFPDRLFTGARPKDDLLPGPVRRLAAAMRPMQTVEAAVCRYGVVARNLRACTVI